MSDRKQQQLTPDTILDLALGFFRSKTLLSAVELGVFHALAEGPMEFNSLSQKLGLHPRGARDFLDALVALKMLERKGSVYYNSPEADHFLDRRKPSYIGGIVEMANTRLYPSWKFLTDGLRTGKPQNELKDGGDNPFDTLYADPAKLREFVGAMTGITTGVARAIAGKPLWADYNSFVDIGAAQGAFPVQVALARPQLKAIGFDLPPVKPVFEDYVESFGLSERVRFQGGDFFKDPFPKAEVIVMGMILHDWDLDTKRMLIAKAYEALPKGGAVVIYEMLIDDERRENAGGLLMSLNMLIETPGGFDYTGADAQRWLHDAGFRQTWSEHACGPHSMVVGIK